VELDVGSCLEGVQDREQSSGVDPLLGGGAPGKGSHRTTLGRGCATVTEVRLATFNILHGRSPSDGRVDLDRLGDSVAALDADVLALQEVDRNQRRSQLADLTAVAGEAMGAVAYRFVPALRGDPHRWVPATDSDPPDAPAYGVALLSRHPVRSWNVVSLPRPRVRVPIVRQGDRLPTLVREEPRVAVSATIEAPGGTVTVVNTHLSYVPWWNGHQLATLTRSLPDHDHPLVLVGDLNMGPGRATRITGMSALASGRTFPAHAPQLQLDHVLAEQSLPVAEAGPRQLPLSDHRALVVDLAGAWARQPPDSRAT
jgi:endonuclease/exonuclease/phosphatase family metal-dependent hydrolase